MRHPYQTQGRAQANWDLILTMKPCQHLRLNDETMSAPSADDETMSAPSADDETMSAPSADDETMSAPSADDETMSGHSGHDRISNHLHTFFSISQVASLQMAILVSLLD